MDVRKLLANPRFNWQRSDPPEPQHYQQFLQSAPENLPVTYQRLMQACNGGSGEIPYDPGFIEIAPVERVSELGAKHSIVSALPGFFAFGTDRERNLFVFDLRQNDGASVGVVSLDDLAAENIEMLASSFSAFLEKIALMGGTL
jgi:hypothetical protein